MSLPHVMLGIRAVCRALPYEGTQGADVATIDQSSGYDTVDTLGGDDTIILAADTEGVVVDAGGGNDQILVQGDDADITAAGGDDSVFLYDGSTGNTLSGGAGADTLSLENLSAGVTIDLRDAGGSGQYGVITQDGVVLANVDNTFEHIVGTIYDDVIYSNSTSQTIDGNGGNDFIDGGQGRDSLLGGAGNDTFAGGQGADVMIGGGGIDGVDYSTSASGVNVNLEANTGAGGDAQGDTFAAIANLTGSASGDVLIGDGGSNVLSGGGGNDVLDGRAGDDTLIGGQGSDTLMGGAGTDVAVFAGNRSLYTILNHGNGSWTVIDDRPNSPMGTDVLTGIEILRFDDGDWPNTINQPPVVDHPLDDQAATEDAAFFYAIPAGSFRDPDLGDILTYSATLADGDPLPAWLSFDPIAGIFSGTPLNEHVGPI